MILLIDNYDSFVYNIYQYLCELGQTVIVKRNDEITLDGIKTLDPDYIVISPGPCSPNEAGISLKVIQQFADKKPILGVCLGHQAIGQVFGGKVIRANHVLHGKLSAISHEGKGIFKGIPSPFRATRYHSLILERDTLPADLEVTALSEDGYIMGIKHKKFPVEGVQFHPEAILTEYGKKLLLNFIENYQHYTGIKTQINSVKTYIDKVVMGKNLTEEEMQEAIESIMDGKTTDSQIAAFLTALRLKGETVDEITGAVRVMREKSVKLHRPEGSFWVDTCGTGGDKTGTFNISTAASFVAAGAGVVIAKHGNRAVSSKSGSADVLLELGVKIDLTPAQAEKCIEKVGICFLFAPKYHISMKYSAGPRQEIGIRTIFNILGPLANPAFADGQVMGVFAPELTEKLAEVLLKLGTKRGFVVHGGDGLDEISTTTYTKITEINSGWQKTYYIEPEDFGFERAKMEDIKGGEAKENAQIVRKILNREIKGPKRDIVLLNAAAAIAAGMKAKDIQEGLILAKESLESGKAYAKLNQLIEVTNGNL